MRKHIGLRFGALLLILISQGQIAVLGDTEPIPPEEPQKPFNFMSGTAKQLHADFIRKALDIILENGLYQSKPLDKLIFFEPDEIIRKFDFSLGEEGVSQEELLKIIEKLFEISPKPGHRFRLSKRVAGLDPLAVAGDWMATTMSNNVVSYLVSPIWTLMEIKMTEYLCKQIGWKKTGDGVPTSGAGVANSMALATAMHHVDLKTRDIGLFHYKQDQLVIYISKHASISWKTAAIYDGFGLGAIHEIAVDEWGRMDSIDLGKKIVLDKKFGRIPVMVVATAGTPILGVIDPIDRIASVCRRYKIWLHVDAELAGGYLFTSDANGDFRYKLNGIQRADSVTVSMWLFSAPYTNSMLLTRNRDALQNTFGLHPTYVYTGVDTYNMSYDRGDHTIQTSRRPEIAKIWFSASRGEQNSHALFKAQDEMKREFINILETTPGFVLVKTSTAPIAHQIPLVSFYYVPRDFTDRGKCIGHFKRLVGKRMREVKYQLQRRGLADVSISKIKHTPDCLTIVFKNGRLTSAELNWLVRTIRTLGENPFAEGVTYDQNPVDANTGNYPTFPSQQIYADLMKSMLNIAFDEGIFFSRKEKVFDFRKPEVLSNPENFDFNLPYNGTDLDTKLKESFRSIIYYSPHWAHPYFIYQLGAGLDPYTTVADYVVPVLNTPMISYYNGSAPFVLMEKELVKQMLRRVYNSEEGEGTITDGGSMANQMPIAMAKYNLDKENFKNHGTSVTRGKKYIVYLSADGHYSTKKGAILQGIGQNHTIEIESNNIGKMKAHKLKNAIEKTIADGNIPLMVVVTTGTTIYGAIDPVNEIAKVTRHYKVWLHVDGMFGGLIGLSDTYAKIFRGIELTDSWGADLHKLMGSNFVCTILVTRHKDILRHTFKLSDQSQEDDWRDRKNGITDDLNLDGRHLQLDKRNNVFKFWLLWKAKGRKGLEAHVDKIMSNKDFLITELRKRKNEGFELVLNDFELTNVCFHYIPPYLNPDFNDNVNRSSKQLGLEMDKFTFSLEKEFTRNGIILFVTQRRNSAAGNGLLFINFVMMGSALTHNDIRFLLDAVAYYGSKIIVGRSIIRSEETVDKCGRGKFDPFGNLPKYYHVGQDLQNTSDCK